MPTASVAASVPFGEEDQDLRGGEWAARLGVWYGQGHGLRQPGFTGKLLIVQGAGQGQSF